jgi:hypothetical protein
MRLSAGRIQSVADVAHKSLIGWSWPNAAQTGVVTSLIFGGQVQRDRMVKKF